MIKDKPEQVFLTLLRSFQCGHIFHFLCVSMILEKRWTGPRIAFGFRNCPICKSKISHPALRKLMDPIDVLYDDVKKKALMRLEYEGLSKCDAVVTKGARFFNDPAGFALERYAYYVCFKCKKAYYGGEVQCDADAGIGDEYNPVSALVAVEIFSQSTPSASPRQGFLADKARPKALGREYTRCLLSRWSHLAMALCL